MPGTAFNSANWSGYDERPATNPASALTDFTLLIDISRLSASWKSAIQSDGADIRLTNGSNTELPFDLINFAYNAGAPTGWIRVKYTGTLASSGTQNVRVWAGYTGGTAVAYSDSETYGSDNAYASHWKGYWPDGGSADRTANGNTLTGTSITPGGVSGKVGVGTSYNGTTSRADATASIPSGEPITLMCWGLINAATTGTPISVADKDVDNQQHRLIATHGASGTLVASTFDGSSGADSTIVGLVSSVSWTHFAGVFASSTSRTAYLSGTAGTTNTTSKSVAGIDRATLGVTADSTPFGFFAGSLNEAQLHSAALSAAWIAEEYAQSNSQSTFWGTWAWTANNTRKFTQLERGIRGLNRGLNIGMVN